MGYVLGVDFGSTTTTVAMATRVDDAARSALIAEAPSVVFLGDRDELVVGEQAEELGILRPHRLIRHFKQRFGDPVPMMADGRSERAECMAAAVIGELVNRVSAAEGAAPESVAVSHPAEWGTYKQALLADALEQVGVTDVRLIAEPAAAAQGAIGENAKPSKVIVYDLGGDGFNACVMSRAASGAFVLSGRPQEIDGVGGQDFDQAVFSHVQRAVGLDKANSADRDVLVALRDLRLACRTAKEALSSDTETTIEVLAPWQRTRVRLVRAEFEEFIRDAVEDTLEATQRCVKAAGLGMADIDAILLVGGSSRIPLVAQMISAEFEKPLIIGDDPQAAISLGAALFAAHAAWPQPSVAGKPATEPLATPSEADPAAPQSPAARPAESVTPVGGEHRPAVAGIGVSDTVAPPSAPQMPAAAAFAGAGLGGRAEPARGTARIDQRGRHRHQRQRRYWVRTTGIVASVAGVLLLGTSIAASKAAEPAQPGGGSPVQGSIVVTSGQNPVVASAASGGNAAGSMGQPAIIATTVPQTSAGTSADAAPARAGAVTEQRGTGTAADPTPTPSLVPWLVPDIGQAPVNAPAVVVALGAQSAGPAASTSGSTAGGARVTR